MDRSDPTTDPGGNPFTVNLPTFDPPEMDELKGYPFLSAVAETVLKKLQPNLIEREYLPGDVVLRSGDYSDAAYYIGEGVLEVRLETFGQTPTRQVRTSTNAAPGLASRLKNVFSRQPLEQAVQLGGLSADGTVILDDAPAGLRSGDRVLLEQGDIFGELSALSRYPISADVVAVAETRCLMIRTPALRLLLKQKALADFKKMVDERYRSRSLASHLRNVELFKDIGDALLGQLQQKAQLLSFEPGAQIVEQDTPGESFYLVRGGYVKVGVRAGAGNLAVAYLRKGDHAGEISLLLGEPWPFSLHALEHVEIVKIDRTDFEEIIAEHPEIQALLWEGAVARLKERGRATHHPASAQYLQMAMDTGLVHGESVLLIDLNTCTRCDDCVRACADTHGGTPRFIREGERFRQWSIPASCYQCTDPVCMIGCPTGAITRPVGTLEVTINRSTCIGCHNCVRRCPWDNIIEVPYSSPTLNRDIDLATKCDLCLGRAAGPACVQMCPHGSTVRISFKDTDTVGDILSGERGR
jgi:CRP-like cAMP-binding protein/Fe-S-cluster-containing hydrogenase component 2